MDLQHELVKVHPALIGRGRLASVEQVHQHRLAPAHRTVEIDAPWRRLLLAAPAAPQTIGPGRLIAGQGLVQGLQAQQRVGLGWVGPQLALVDERLEATQEVLGQISRVLLGTLGSSRT